MSNAILDALGAFMAKNLRDRAIGFFDDIAEARMKAPSLGRLQRDLARLTPEQRAIARRCVVAAVDSAAHDFLFALQEQFDVSESTGVHVVVNGEDAASVSDGLNGEIFTADGWFARFSAYGEPPEEN